MWLCSDSEEIERDDWSLNFVKQSIVWSATTYSFHYKFVVSRQQE